MRSKSAKRRKIKNSNNDFYGYILIFIVSILIIGTEILVDRTDPYNEIQKLSIKNKLHKIRK